MSIFEASQTYRKEIEGSTDIVRKLKQYVINEKKLPFLGEGTSNMHYRLGQLPSGLWLATREHTIFPRGNPLRVRAETYAQDLENAYNEGKRISKICLGVRVHLPSEDDLSGMDEEMVEQMTPDRFFLIVEDFTANGTTDFRPASQGREYGFIEGERIYHDFDTEKFEVLGTPLKFMTNDAMIHITPD